MRLVVRAVALILAIAVVLCVLLYLVIPQFERTSVQMPESCNTAPGTFKPPPDRTYLLPQIGNGVRVAANDQFALVAVIDYAHPPFPSTVFLVNRTDNQIIQRIDFPNDVIAAAFDANTLVLYNDKLGYLIDPRTGQLENNILLMDNYGGLSESDRPIISRASTGHWYFETTAVLSSWNVDGTFKPRHHLTFGGIALGCFIDGATNQIIALK